MKRLLSCLGLLFADAARADEPPPPDNNADTSEPVRVPRRADPADSDAAPPPASSLTLEPTPDVPSRTEARTTPSAWAPRYRITGELRMAAFVTQNDPNVAFIGRNDGFVFQTARVAAQFELGTRVSARLALDGAVDERAHMNAKTGTLRPRLGDAFGDVHLGATYLRVGRFTQIASSEVTPSHERLLVTLPLEARGMPATLGWEVRGLDPTPSLGLAVHSGPDASFIYEVAIQNGADEFAASNDNDWVSLAAAAGYRRPGLLAIVGAYVNPRTVGDLPTQQSELDYGANAGLTAQFGTIRLGVGGAVRATQFSTTGGQNQIAAGAHATVGFTVLSNEAWSVLIAGRGALLEPSSLIASDLVIEPSIGITAAWPALHMRAQLGATAVLEETARAVDNHRIEGAVELAW